MATAYERLDNLEQVVIPAMQEDIEELQENAGGSTAPVILEAGEDVHTLAVGLYIAPNAATLQSLANKPPAGNVSGYFEVLAGGTEGQKIIRFFPCSKTNKVFYQCAFYMSTWGDWLTIGEDSGWITLPLLNGATVYNAAQAPQYRKIDNRVYIRGIFKGITGACQVASLPEGFRPSQRLMINVQRTGYMIDRIEIETNGAINYVDTNASSTTEAIWHSFHDTSFFVD